MLEPAARTAILLFRDDDSITAILVGPVNQQKTEENKKHTVRDSSPARWVDADAAASVQLLRERLRYRADGLNKAQGGA